MIGLWIIAALFLLGIDFVFQQPIVLYLSGLILACITGYMLGFNSAVKEAEDILEPVRSKLEEVTNSLEQFLKEQDKK